MLQQPSDRLARVVFLCAIAAHAASLLVTVARFDGEQIAKSWFADDAFYYLEVANHVAAGHGSTFDGAAATNGYHPLWMVVCCLVAWCVPRAAQVETIFLLQGAFVAVSAVCIRSALARWNAWAAAMAASLLLAAVGGRSILLNGMESALGMVLLSATARFTFALADGRVGLAGWRQAVTAYLLLAGVALSRLEMGMLPAVWLAAGWWQARLAADAHARRLRLVAVAAGLALTALVYVGVNMLTANWPVPISGSVKWGQVEASAVWWNTVQSHGLAFVALVRPLISLASWPFVVAASGLLLTMLAWFLVAERRSRSTVSIFVVLCVAFVVVVCQRSGGFLWYGWPALFLGTLATFALFERFATVVAGGRRRLAAIVAVLVGAWCVVSPCVRSLRARPTVLFDWTAPEALWDACLAFVRDRIPANETLAGTAVGHLSFASGRPIVQVEGLVNDRAYLEALRKGEAALELERRGVRWLLAPMRGRAALEALLGGFYRPERVESIVWLVDHAKLDLGTDDDVAIVRLR